MRSATSAGNEPALVVNMKKILADSDLVDAMSMELGPAGNYRGKVPVSHMGRLRRKKRLAKNQPELNFSYSFTMPLPHAALLHFRRIARRGAGCVSFGAACRAGSGSSICGPRAVAAPAGLWTRRAHEDRNRPGALSFGRASRQDDRLADLGGGWGMGAGKIEKVAAGGNGGSGETQARGVAAPRPRRSCWSFSID